MAVILNLDFSFHVKKSQGFQNQNRLTTELSIGQVLPLGFSVSPRTRRDPPTQTATSYRHLADYLPRDFSSSKKPEPGRFAPSPLLMTTIADKACRPVAISVSEINPSKCQSR